MNNNNLNDQIIEFFKSNGKITKVKEGERSLPEYLWYKETYPKNYKLRRANRSARNV